MEIIFAISLALIVLLPAPSYHHPFGGDSGEQS